MSQALLQKFRTERDDLVQGAEALMNGDFDPADPALVEVRSKIDTIDARIQAIVDFESKRNAANKIDSIALRHRQDTQDKQTRESNSMSIGEAWTRSKAYADYVNTPRGTSGRIQLPFEAIQERAPILTTSFADVIESPRIAESKVPPASTPLLDLISQIRVGANSVEWVFFPAGDPDGTVTAEGAPKTEAAIAPELKTVTLETIASWAQYSRQFGEDAPGLVDYLNASLGRGIRNKREKLAGAVLAADTDIPVTTNTGGTLLEGIRYGIADIEDIGYAPQAVALNPRDYATLDIELLGKTMRGAVVNGDFWSVRPVPVRGVPSGTAYVGDFATAMVELVRSEVSVYTTDSHGSTFVSNVLTTLVEARAKTIVHQPMALTKVTGTVGGAPFAAKAK